MQKRRTLRSVPAYWYLVALLAAAALAASVLFLGSAQKQTSLEIRLENILSSIEGAGSVRVLINESAQQALSAWNVMQPASEEQGIVGVLIVAQGAADPVVAAKLAQAAGTALGVAQSQIEIMRMQK